VFKGLIGGLITSLIAMGIVLVYRSSRVINFAVGSIGIPAAALFAVMAGVHGWPYWPSLILSLILGTLTGVIVELAVIRRLFKSPRVIVLVATIGVAQLCEAITLALPDYRTGSLQTRFPVPFEGQWNPIADIEVTSSQLLVLIVSWTNRRATPYAVDRRFRILQLFSASMYSLGHGGNDAQKTMGIIAVLLYSQGMLGTQFHVPFWVVLSCQAAMGLGTLFGGWRIVHTMGSRITQLKPIQGFCAETGGAITLFIATGLGVPVSTTHTITGAIVGVGAARRATAVRWSVAQRIVVAWVITMPAAGAVGAATYWLVHRL